VNQSSSHFDCPANFIYCSVNLWTPILGCHLLPSIPTCQSFPSPYAIKSPMGETLAQQSGLVPKVNDFILFLTLKSQKFIKPSLPHVMNQIELTGEKETALTGYKMIELGFSSNL